MEKEKNAPSLKDKATASEIGLYVRYWLKKYINTPKCESEVLEKLKVIFFDGSDRQDQILKVDDFGTVFHDKIGKRRMPYLKELLMKIDPTRYGSVHY